MHLRHATTALCFELFVCFFSSLPLSAYSVVISRRRSLVIVLEFSMPEVISFLLSWFHLHESTSSSRKTHHDFWFSFRACADNETNTVCRLQLCQPSNGTQWLCWRQPALLRTHVNSHSIHKSKCILLWSAIPSRLHVCVNVFFPFLQIVFAVGRKMRNNVLWQNC